MSFYRLFSFAYSDAEVPADEFDGLAQLVRQNEEAQPVVLNNFRFRQLVFPFAYNIVVIVLGSFEVPALEQRFKRMFNDSTLILF